MGRLADAAAALAAAASSPEWDAALEHYRHTAVQYAIEHIETDIQSFAAELELGEHSPDLRIFLVWLSRTLNEHKNPP